jgi:hypothetical protein
MDGDCKSTSKNSRLMLNSYIDSRYIEAKIQGLPFIEEGAGPGSTA